MKFHGWNYVYIGTLCGSLQHEYRSQADNLGLVKETTETLHVHDRERVSASQYSSHPQLFFFRYEEWAAEWRQPACSARSYWFLNIWENWKLTKGWIWASAVSGTFYCPSIAAILNTGSSKPACAGKVERFTVIRRGVSRRHRTLYSSRFLDALRQMESHNETPFHREEINSTVWEVPEKYLCLKQIGTGAYGSVW